MVQVDKGDVANFKGVNILSPQNVNYFLNFCEVGGEYTRRHNSKFLSSVLRQF